MTINRPADGRPQSRSYVEAYGEVEVVGSGSALPAASAVNSVASEPVSDEASGIAVFPLDSGEVQVVLAIESQGDNNATIDVDVRGYTKGTEWEPHLLLDTVWTIGQNTNSSADWESCDTATITNDYTFGSTAGVMGGGTDGRQTLVFDAGGFQRIEVRVKAPTAGTNLVRVKKRRLT